MYTEMTLRIEEVKWYEDGRKWESHWAKPMYEVNGKYIASSIDPQNVYNKPFDLNLSIGETVNVVIDVDRFGHSWIARKA